MDWLIARAIAHRGLHDAARGVIENTPSAVAAALAAGYGIEVDLQLSADGEAMVHHDAALDRLTETRGALRDFTAAALKKVTFRNTADRMLALGDLLDLVGSRTPLVLELKSRFDGDVAIATRTAAVLRGYSGPVAAMSFDPVLVAAFAERARSVPRGIVAQRRPSPSPAAAPSNASRQHPLALLLHAAGARPHFLAYRLQDIATVPALIARRLLRMPLLTWTVRSEKDRAFAVRHADQVIFEGFRPQVKDRA